MSSQKAVEKNENVIRAFRRARKSQPRVSRQAGSRRNFRRKVTASAVLLSILFLTFPFTLLTPVGLARETIVAQGGLPQADIDAINALAAFNIGTPYQPPQASQPGVVVATEIGSDAGFPPLFNGPLKSVKVLLPLVREAAVRKMDYYSGETKTATPSLPAFYPRKEYFIWHRGQQVSPTALERCEQAEGAGNCDVLTSAASDKAFPKCKPGYYGNGGLCQLNPNQNANLSPSAEAIAAELRQVASDPKAKLKLAPFMLRVAWEALAANNPTPAQQAFYQYFQYYASWQNQMVTQKTLVQWCKHKKNWPKSPASVMIGTGNAKSAGFKPEPIPMSIGRNGGLAVDQLLTPAIVLDLARRDPYWQDNLPDLAAKGQAMYFVLTSLKFDGASAAAIMVSITGELPDGWPGSKLPMVLQVQNLLKSQAGLIARTGIGIGIAALGKLISGILGAAISAIGIPVAIIAFALEVLIKNIIAEIETPKFEAELVRGSKEAQPADIRGLIYTAKPGYGDGLKIGVMSHLIKMMIIDPADGTAFGPSNNRVFDPFQQLNPNDACSGLEQQGLFQ